MQVWPWSSTACSQLDRQWQQQLQLELSARLSIPQKLVTAMTWPTRPLLALPWLSIDLGSLTVVVALLSSQDAVGQY